MKTLRYQTWRRSVALASLLLLGSFVGGILFNGERWVFVFEILFWLVLAGSVAFQATVSLLRKIGVLEFSYNEADRNSYLYNQEILYRQMREVRRKKDE